MTGVHNHAIIACRHPRDLCQSLLYIAAGMLLVLYVCCPCCEAACCGAPVGQCRSTSYTEEAAEEMLTWRTQVDCLCLG